MPRKRTKTHLPRAMSQLAVTMEGKTLPANVDRVFEIVRQAMKDRGNNNPATKVNRKFGQLKRRNAANLKDMHDWLIDTETYRQLSQLGQSGNHGIWVLAIEKILAGKTATSAFGSKTGPKSSWEFSKNQRLGLRILHKIRIGKLNPEKAIAKVLAEEGLIDDRDLRRSYTTVKIMAISDETLQLLSKS